MNAEHNCVCRDYPGAWHGCQCGVYSDEHGDWCANENCRALLESTLGRSLRKMNERVTAWVTTDGRNYTQIDAGGSAAAEQDTI